MTVTIESTARTAPTSAMTGLLDEMANFTDVANRPDLGDRLARAWARVSDPILRIVVTGQSGQGMSALVDAIAGVPVTADGSQRGLPVMVTTSDTAYSRQSSSGSGMSRMEVGITPPLLAQGVVLIDTPGIYGADTAAAATVLELAAGADAVLFVSDASQEYTAPEIEFLAQLRQLCPTVLGVGTKIDLYARWTDIQDANRAHLDNAGLGIPLLPVSALLARTAHAEGDRELAVESGVPQLVDFVRGHVIAGADARQRGAIADEVFAAADQLMMTHQAELRALCDPANGGELVAELQRAVAASKRLRAQSARWQLVLGDGIVEVMAEVEHDLRHRLRQVVREAEADIMKLDPAKRWEQFELWLREKIARSVQASFVLANTRAGELADRVAQVFAADGVIMLPRLGIDEVGDALDSVASLEALETRKANLIQRLINALRGSYGGLLMVGVLTSVGGLALLNPWSIGAGVLLGGYTFYEDRKARLAARQAEAKTAVARLLDDVLFQMGDESRLRLREVHRTVRDHFAAIAEEMDESIEAALGAAQQAHHAHTAQRETRLAQLQATLARLGQLKARASALAS
ncbi:MAG TPA: dynamin family protein [Pseudonocardia sp.]|jgi:hypothetical protein|uniref:dynamin family protein n=1 Tax=Pseudonocardia sp. TaxID=60912 RepID=UPI002F3FE8D6